MKFVSFLLDFKAKYSLFLRYNKPKSILKHKNSFKTKVVFFFKGTLFQDLAHCVPLALNALTSFMHVTKQKSF